MKYHYDEFNKNEYESHRLALGCIDPGSKILDVGCATGYFARQLTKKNCETWGVDNDKLALKKASKYCKKVILSNVDEVSSLTVPKKYFDYIVILDVIEHLRQPKNILSLAKHYLKDGGKIIISVPNIAHASIRWMLLKGEFRYTTTGILDETHVHFYTQKSIIDLLKKMGYKIIKIIPTNGMCKVPLLYIITDRLPTSWQYRLVELIPDLFSYQFIVEADLIS